MPCLTKQPNMKLRTRKTVVNIYSSSLVKECSTSGIFKTLCLQRYSSDCHVGSIDQCMHLSRDDWQQPDILLSCHMWDGFPLAKAGLLFRHVVDKAVLWHRIIHLQPKESSQCGRQQRKLLRISSCPPPTIICAVTFI